MNIRGELRTQPPEPLGGSLRNKLKQMIASDIRPGIGMGAKTGEFPTGKSGRQ
jgi:hypothetical protein